MSRKTSMINGMSLICGIVCAVCAFLARMLSGSPLDMVHKLEGLELLPPIWIFNLICVIWYFLVGAAAGTVIYAVSNRCIVGKEELWAYRGGLFFLVSFFCGIIWYPLFFIGEAVFFSFLTCLIITISSILCAYFWFVSRVKGSALIMSAYSIWSFYQLIINVSVLLGI